MKILVINAGSSSLKFQLIDMENEQVIAKGICEEIGGKSGFKYKVPGREDYKAAIAMPTHAEALKLVLDKNSGRRNFDRAFSTLSSV